MANETSDHKSEQDKRFETLAREITVAAREQGGDPDENFQLRDAMRRAKGANMPEASIEEARVRGSDSSQSTDYEQVTYEGYGPDGVAVLVEAITDNLRESAAGIEELFEAHGGNLGEDGCVSWQFERRGLVRVPAEAVDDEDTFMLEVIEMGADELREPVFDSHDGGRRPTYRVYCDPNDVKDIDHELRQAGYPVYSARIQFDATQRVELAPDRARNFLNFFEKLSAREDVTGAYANWSV